MENNVPKFATGYKVFAKMKGYVAWPAVVDGTRSDSGNKKYDVFFYGTHQVGVCREEDLKPYVENRSTLGRPKHFKGFNEAVQEMDQELGLAYQSDVGYSTLDSENESDPPKKVEKKRSRKRSNSETRTRSRSVSSFTSETPAKRGRDRLRSLSRCRNDTPEVKVRGRERQRPMSQSRSSSISPSRLQPTIIRSRCWQRSLFRTREDSLKDDPTWRPNQSKSKPRSSSQRTSLVVARKRAFSLGDGDSDVYAKPNLKALISKSCVIDPFVESDSARAEVLKFLKNEAALNNAVFGIQVSLNLKAADLLAATRYIDEIFILDLNPLLLKKHPEAVETFKNLQIYSGNIENWNMSNSAKLAFEHEVEIINRKAIIIYNKFKELFHIPNGKDFSQVFEEELEKFKSAIQGIPMETVWKMTRDPTLVKDTAIERRSSC